VILHKPGVRFLSLLGIEPFTTFDRDEMRDQLHSPVASALGRNPEYPLQMRLGEMGDLESRSGHGDEEYVPASVIEPWSSILNQSLH